MGSVFSLVCPSLSPLVNGWGVLGAEQLDTWVHAHEKNLLWTTSCRKKHLKETLSGSSCAEFS